MGRQALLQGPTVLELRSSALLRSLVSLEPLSNSYKLILFGSGYMTPFVFISVYTGEKLPNISSQLANLPIPIMSFASAIGRTTVGLAADRIGFINAFILVISISAFSQVVLWNVAAESYAGIMVFSYVSRNTLQ